MERGGTPFAAAQRRRSPPTLANNVRTKNLIFQAAPAISGFLLFSCFPRMSCRYVAWVALVPLVWHLGKVGSAKKAFAGGFLTGAIAWFGLLIWIPKVLVQYGGVPGALSWLSFALLIGLLACYPAAACFLTRLCIERRGQKYLLAFPFAWVAIEYLREYTPFGGFPWLQTGYSQTGSRLMQLADITGVYGISFLLVVVNTALAWYALRGFRRGGIVPALACLALLATGWAYGRLAFGWWEKTTPCCTAAILQESLSLDEPESELARQYLGGYVQMASQLPPDSVNLLLLPESPSPLIYQYDAGYRQALQTLARRFSLGMIFNNISYSIEGGQSRYFNSAYFLNHEGRESGRYDKIHLVPFGEYVPLKKLFFFVDSISKDVSDFSPGRAFVTVELDDHRVCAIICFEAVFPDLVRRFVARGSELIVNLTDDAWYGDSAAPYQHLEMARWRAVENRRYLLRAANSGISAVIGPDGEIRESTRLFQRTALTGPFGFIRAQTVYTRYGNAFALACAIIMIALLVNVFRPVRTHSCQP